MIRTNIDCCYAGTTDVSTNAVVAETGSGRRFLHTHNFATLAGAERMVARVIEAGYINEDHWVEIDPVYGSEAFSDQEAEAYIYAEALRAGHITEAEVPDVIRTLL